MRLNFPLSRPSPLHPFFIKLFLTVRVAVFFQFNFFRFSLKEEEENIFLPVHFSTCCSLFDENFLMKKLHKFYFEIGKARKVQTLKFIQFWPFVLFLVRREDRE